MCKERRNGKCGTNVYVLVGEISGQELYVKVYIPVRTVCVRGRGWDRNFKLQACVMPFEYIPFTFLL